MEAPTEPSTAASAKGWTKGDLAFIFFIALVVVAVTWLGVLARKEALKTEGSKRNGEQWVAWLTQESAKRFEPGYAPIACAAGKHSAEANAEAKPNTWGDCLNHVLTQTEFKDMRNPFTGKAPVFIPACDPADHSLVGSIVFDKITPNPPGSAVASVNSQLMPTDSIAEKIQVKIAICDKGSYAIKIAEIEF